MGPSKEWKPKPTNPNASQPSSTVSTSEVPPIVIGTSTQSLTVTAAEEATSKLQKKLEELHFSDNRNVIIPNHLQVPEAERTGLSFGSFDASFAMSTSFANGPDSDKIATPLSESSQEIEETAEEEPSSRSEALTMLFPFSLCGFKLLQSFLVNILDCVLCSLNLSSDRVVEHVTRCLTWRAIH